MTLLNKALTIAGSDTSGGAGMEADLKTMEELGVYGMPALTCIVTMHPKTWEHSVYPLPLDLIEKQLVTAIEGVGINAMKTGMIGSPELVELVAQTIDKYALKNEKSIKHDLRFSTRFSKNFLDFSWKNVKRKTKT